MLAGARLDICGGVGRSSRARFGSMATPGFAQARLPALEQPLRRLRCRCRICSHDNYWIVDAGDPATLFGKRVSRESSFYAFNYYAKRSPMKIVAVILTFNESLHLARCIDSLEGVVDEIVVVDSFSSDSTVEIAREHDAIVLQHEFKNQATQFNWAISQLGDDVGWVFRIDADEYVTPTLRESLRNTVENVSVAVNGITCRRRMTFQGKMIHHGGVFPIEVLRLFRFGFGQSENRWMDEHIVVSGDVVSIPGEIIDDNLQPLTWWIDKHNKYSSREAVEVLNRSYGFLAGGDDTPVSGSRQAKRKRWIKEHVYYRIPGGLRALSYFFYRYIIRLGFLDGASGTAFHVLQGFWYRYLVDKKVCEVERYIRENDCDIFEGISKVLGIDCRL